MKKRLKRTALALALAMLWSLLAAGAGAANVTMKTSLSSLLPSSSQATGCAVTMGPAFSLGAGETRELVRALGTVQLGGVPEKIIGSDEEGTPILEFDFEGADGRSFRVYESAWGDISAEITSGGNGTRFLISEKELENILRPAADAVAGHAPLGVFGEPERYGADADIRLFSADGLYYTDGWFASDFEKSLKPRLGGDLGKAAAGAGALEVRGNAWKARYDLYENGVRMTLTSQRLLGDTVYAAVSMTFSEAEYPAFLKRAQAAVRDAQETGPAWLGIVNPAKIVHASFTDEKGRTVRITDTDLIAQTLDEVRVSPGSGKTLADKNSTLPYSSRIEVSFTRDIIYRLDYTDRELLISSSDMKNAVRYKLKNACALDDFRSAKTPIKANPDTAKPVIYLYPETTQKVSVTLDFMGELTYTYPRYRDGWTVTAHPDGRLTDAEGEYYYLFWEGVSSQEWICDKGSVVPGAQTEPYLRRTLEKMGLTPREYNDFITYWVPRMKDNAYNLISFSEEQYDEVAKLHVSPEPDSVLRVHMVWKALDKPVEIEPQEYRGFERRGFTVVEWGGTQIG